MGEKHFGHVFIEGSSTAKGYGDETGRLGFAGRLHYNYLGYNNRPSEQRNPCQGVVVHLDGEADNSVPVFSRWITRNVNRGREPYASLRRVQKIGVFVLTSAVNPSAIDALGGRKAYRVYWRDSLERLAEECQNAQLTPLILTTPDPDEQTRFRNGNRPDMEMSMEIARLNRRAVDSMEAEYISFEEIIGGATERDRCMADDTLHPNALGHTRIAYGLASRINKHLGIGEELGVFPEIIGAYESRD